METASQRVEVVGKAEAVEVVFRFANKSSQDIKIINAYAGCHCLAIELPVVVPAHATADIRAKFTGISQLPVKRVVEFTTRPWLPNLIASVSFVGAPIAAEKRIEVQSDVESQLFSPSAQEMHSVINRSGSNLKWTKPSHRMTSSQSFMDQLVLYPSKKTGIR